MAPMLYMFILLATTLFLTYRSTRESSPQEYFPFGLAVPIRALSALDVYLFNLRCTQDHAELL